MKQKKRQNLSDNEKEKIYDDLVKLANTLDKKEEHKHSDHDDLDYFVIRELENLFTNNDDYYKPVLEVLLKKIMNTMKSEEIKIKNYQ